MFCVCLEAIRTGHTQNIMKLIKTRACHQGGGGGGVVLERTFTDLIEGSLEGLEGQSFNGGCVKTF